MDPGRPPRAPQGGLAGRAARDGRLRALIAGGILAALCLLADAPTASAKGPSRFVGMNLDGPALQRGSGPRELRRVARAGAGSVRWAIYWPELQPHAAWSKVPAGRRRNFRDVGGIPTDFRATDRFVGAAVRAGLEPLPVVMAAAPWAAENPFVEFSPPHDAALFGRFARTLAARYGSGGTFWRRHRKLPRRPIRTWQIWNEPAGADGFRSPSWSWSSKRDALTGYLAILRAARDGLRSADPRARVALSGFFGSSWVALEEVYAAGARGAFDEVAIHPYTREPANVVQIVRLARDVMTRYGDGAKPIVVTELSWPSAAGSVPDPLAFSVTEAEQAVLLARGYRALSRTRQRLGVRAVYWYTWMSGDVSPVQSFDYAGLLTTRDGSLTRKPALRAFRRVARALSR